MPSTPPTGWRTAHFLNKILFCFFAEDAKLLPSRLFSEIIANTRSNPGAFQKLLADLFRSMSDKDAWFGADQIKWFNGGLFDGDDVLPLEGDDIATLATAARLDWSDVEPSVLGTLFERGLDPDKRGQLGAHYTDKQSILRVVEPVIMQPLRREYEAMQGEVEKHLAAVTRKPGARRGATTKRESDAQAAFRRFLERLRSLRILDPACGSGNFLYVALQCVKDLEKEAILWAWERLPWAREFPRVDPTIVHGIEINDYAAELARVTVWIGEIQWMLGNGYAYQKDPILRPLDNIECRDAILRHDAKDNPIRAEWPNAEFIIGNPPFLGDRRMRGQLGDKYVDQLRAAWDGFVPGGADLVCYWHEKAREMIAARRAKRAGLIATNSIRGGANRRVLDRVKETGDIFFAWGDEPWIVEGAAVRVSIVGQDDGSERARSLDGRTVSLISADLTADSTNVTLALRLVENAARAFVGVQKSGPFDLEDGPGRAMLAAPTNPSGVPNSDVVRRWVNASDLTGRAREAFIVDFGTSMSVRDAAK